MSSAKKNERCPTALSSRRASVRSQFAKGLRGPRWINTSRGWDWLLSSLHRLQGSLPAICRSCVRVPIAMGFSRHVVGASAWRSFIFHARYHGCTSEGTCTAAPISGLKLQPRVGYRAYGLTDLPVFAGKSIAKGRAEFINVVFINVVCVLKRP